MRALMAVLILTAILWLLSGFVVRRFIQAKDVFTENALAKVRPPRPSGGVDVH
jgi:hypothetical protein